MLVISRWVGQRLVIDGQVWITIDSVSKNGRVQVAVHAPRVIEVDREEVYFSKHPGAVLPEALQRGK